MKKLIVICMFLVFVFNLSFANAKLTRKEALDIARTLEYAGQLYSSVSYPCECGGTYTFSKYYKGVEWKLELGGEYQIYLEVHKCDKCRYFELLKHYMRNGFGFGKYVLYSSEGRTM